MTTSPEPREREPVELDDKPPLLGSWRNVYAVVLGVLVFVVALFAIVTEVYA